ncbi:hypothetical protein OHA64_01000 [Streptomyces sp. NBC_00076]
MVLAQLTGTAVLGAVLLVSFLFVERGAVEPVLPLKLFRLRTFMLSSEIPQQRPSALHAYATSITDVFLYAALILLLPFALAWLLKAARVRPNVVRCPAAAVRWR